MWYDGVKFSVGGDHMVTAVGRLGQALTGDLVPAGLEILAGQLGVGGIENISTTAGRLLLDEGVVGTLDQGIVLFHEALAKGRPNLGRILRQLDRRAGRLPRTRLNARALLVKSGLAKRAKATTAAGPRGRLIAMSDKEILRALRSPLLSKRSKDIIRESVKGTRGSRKGR